MSLDEAIAAEPRTAKGPECGVAKLKRRLSPEDGEKVEALFTAVRDGDRTAASVARILTRAGFPFTGNRLANHLRGECKCPR